MQWLREVDEVRVWGSGDGASHPQLRARVEKLRVQFYWLIRLFDIQWGKQSLDMYYFYEMCKTHEEYQRSHPERYEFWESKKQVADRVIDMYLDKDSDLTDTRGMLCAANDELSKLIGE